MLAGGAIYGAAETFGDALLADTLLRGVRGTALKDRVAAGFARNAVSEGTTEAVQEGATRFAGQQSLTDAEALTAYFDSAAAGGLGGGVFGGIAAIRERPQPQGDAAFLQAMDTLASDRQANPTPSTPYRPTLQLPAPVVAVTPDGVAMTTGQQDSAMRADAALVREREAMGLTPDVNAARLQHPAAVPNAGRQPAPYRPLVLPEPVVTVTPDGVAVPAALRDAMDREATAFARERASLGLTPDVNAARARHPAAVSNEGVPPPTPVVTRTPAPTRPTSKTSAEESSEPVPKGVALNTTTPEGEALLGFREKRGNGKVRVRRSDWESDRSYLPLFDAKGQPIPGGNLHRRLLVDAQPLPASESVVPDTAPPPANPTTASPDDSPVSDASGGLDRPALRSVFVEAMARKLPNVTDRESGFYAKSADELIDLIERRDARGLLGRNLGDAKANPASRALFTAATGVTLPRGRGATEDAIYRWAGTDRATEQAREAERRAQREAEARAPVEAFPAFASYAEAKQWTAQRSRAFGGQQAYRATEEYGRLQPILQRLADQMNEGNRTRRLSVLAAAGLAIGDRVQATSRDLVRGVPQTVQGTLFAKSGFPWVRVDDGQTITVSHEGRIEHRREVPWSDRWTKLAEARHGIVPAVAGTGCGGREPGTPRMPRP